MVNVLRLIIWLLSQVTKFISPPPNFRNKIYKKIVIFPITTKAISNECKTQKKEAWKIQTSSCSIIEILLLQAVSVLYVDSALHLLTLCD